MATKTKQPEWTIIANLGDVNPLDYGGYFIYRDETGIYPEEAELLVSDDFGQAPTYTVYRFPLERFKMLNGHLVPFSYEKSWPHPLPQYRQWFQKDLSRIADYAGSSTEELTEAFTSDDPIARADAYYALGSYFGWENLDSYPERELTRREVENRYRQDLEALKKLR